MFLKIKRVYYVGDNLFEADYKEFDFISLKITERLVRDMSGLGEGVGSIVEITLKAEIPNLDKFFPSDDWLNDQTYEYVVEYASYRLKLVEISAPLNKTTATIIAQDSISLLFQNEEYSYLFKWYEGIKAENAVFNFWKTLGFKNINIQKLYFLQTKIPVFVVLKPEEWDYVASSFGIYAVSRFLDTVEINPLFSPVRIVETSIDLAFNASELFYDVRNAKTINVEYPKSFHMNYTICGELEHTPSSVESMEKEFFIPVRQECLPFGIENLSPHVIDKYELYSSGVKIFVKKDLQYTSAPIKILVLGKEVKADYDIIRNDTKSKSIKLQYATTVQARRIKTKLNRLVNKNTGRIYKFSAILDQPLQVGDRLRLASPYIDSKNVIVTSADNEVTSDRGSLKWKVTASAIDERIGINFAFTQPFMLTEIL